MIPARVGVHSTLRLRVWAALAVSIANGEACKPTSPPEPGTISFCGYLVLREAPEIVSCSNPAVTETDLKPLYGLPIISLDLGGTGIKELSWVSKFPKLAFLTVRDCEIKDLSPLAGTSIGGLDISRTRVSDLGPLHDLQSLTLLSMSGTYVTDLRPLAGLVHLEYLNASDTLVEDVAPLAQTPRLTQIQLMSTLVADADALAGRPPPATINLDWSRVTDCNALIAAYGPMPPDPKFPFRTGVSCAPLDPWSLAHARQYIERLLGPARRGGPGYGR